MELSRAGITNKRRRRDTRSPWAIRTVLTGLVLACILPGMLGAMFLLVREYRLGVARLEADTIATARALRQTLDSQLQKAMATALTLSRSRPLSHHDLAEFHRQAREIIELTQAGSIVVLSDETGQQVVNTLRDYGDPLPRHGKPDLVRRVLATGQPVISDIFTGSVLRQPVMTVNVPVTLDDKVAYVLSIGLRPSQFNDILNAQDLPTGWVAGIFDSTGTLAGRIPSPDKFVGQKGTAEFIARIQAAPEGAMETVSREGIPTLSVWSRSPLTGWSVGIGIPRSELERNLVHSLVVVGVGLALLLALGLGLAWIASRKIAGSIQALVDPAIALGAGDSVPLPSLDIKEAAEVSAALCHAAELLKARSTALHESNHSLLAREADLRRAHGLAKFGDWHWDLRSGAVTVSDSIREIVGRDVPSFPEQKGTLLSEASWHRMQAAAQAVVRTGQGYDLELEVNHGNGSTIWINAKCEPIRDADGEVCALFGTLIDITERKCAELALAEARQSYQQHLERQVADRTAELTAANAELEQLRRQDPLTGLQNRGAADERLRLEYRRMKRMGSAYAVLYMDIDHFKRINDRHGHAAGDQVLKRLADLIAASLRETDLAARYGGEEFLVVLADTDTAGAMTLAEKIRRSVAAASFPVAGPVTLSIGIAPARTEDASEDDAVRRADAALYEAKRAGRNTVRECG